MLSLAPRTGCSTLHLVTRNRLLLAHNEDGNDAFHQRLVILRLQPTNGPSIVCLHYPGQLPGQVPAMSSAGLVMTTNFIATREVRPGIPRYVLGRAAITAESIEEAVTIATSDHRAFAFTLNLGSIRERRLICCEVTPESHDVQESRGLFIHTNHLLLPATRNVSQRDTSRDGSSGSRYTVLTRAAEAAGDPDLLGPDDLLGLLGSHEALRQPYSPCRHPDHGSSTRTLATAIFDLRAGSFTLYEGNPCAGRRRVIEPPG